MGTRIDNEGTVYEDEILLDGGGGGGGGGGGELKHPKLYPNSLLQFSGIIKVKIVIFRNLSAKGKMLMVKLRS